MMGSKSDSNSKAGIWAGACIIIALSLFFPSTAIAQQMAVVSVDAPDYVLGTFNATINVENVVALDSGQFDLSFDPTVVNVTKVRGGKIGGKVVPVDMWNFMDKDTVRVLFNLPGVEGVNGSGYLAVVSFDVKGRDGEKSELDISNGLLVDTSAKEIPASWAGAKIIVKAAVPSLTPTTTPPLSQTPTPTPATTPKPRGFGAAFVIGGLFAVACLLGLKRKRC